MKERSVSDLLPVRTKIAYGVGDLGANLLFNTVGFFLLYFLTDVSLLSASLAGIAMMTVRIVDAFTDPFIGYQSDRTRTRWGRRRPFLLFGSLPVGLFFLILFTDTPIQSQGLLFAYVMVVYLLFFVSYSVVNVPYSALTPDMTRDFDERTSLTGYRMACAIVGTLIAAGATQALVSLMPSQRSGFSAVAVLYALVFVVMTLIVFSGVREKNEGAVRPTGSSMFGLYRSALRNRPFVLASVTYVLHTMAVVIISTTLIYYFKYYMKRESLIGTIFLVLLVTAIVFIPVWVRISRKIGKKAAYNAGMALFALTMTAIFFLRPDQLVAMYVLTAVAGVGLSTNFVLPWAIVPDTIEYNELTTGNRNEGVFYGIWSFGPKLGSAASSLLVGMVLDLAGYVPNLPGQTDATLWWIRLVLCVIPAAIMAVGIGVLSFYPITHRKYNEIIQELARRRGKGV